MEEEGKVSIWFANMESEVFLDNYVDLIYDYDEEEYDKYGCKPSEFLKDFKIDMNKLDEDFIEKVNYDFVSDKVDKLLKDCSYSDKVIPRLCKKIGNKIEERVNTIILIYNFNYSEEVLKINEQKYSIQYQGSVSYI